MIFDALSNAAYRVSLHGPGAELERGCSNTPNPARSAPSTVPARVNFAVIINLKAKGIGTATVKVSLSLFVKRVCLVNKGMQFTVFAFHVVLKTV